MGSSIALAAASAALVIQSATPAAQSPLKPFTGEEEWRLTSPFAISSTADQCAATAHFRRAEQEIVVVLKARPTTDKFGILIYGPGDLGGEPWEEGKFSLGRAELEKDSVLLEPTTNAGIIIYQFITKRTELDVAGANPDLQIRATGNPLELSLIGLGTARAPLDACSSELLSRWGYSKEFQRSLASYPQTKKPLGHYANSNDYPASAVRRGAVGVTEVLVDVGTNGRSSNCRIIHSSGHQDIDAMTCTIVTRRVRYEPARKADGSAVVAPVYLTMRWELPR